MKRKLRALIPSVIAALAMSALAAGTSHAALKATCAEYPCVITGVVAEHPGISGAVHLIKTDKGQEVFCDVNSFDITVASSEANERVTVTPTLDSCTSKGGGTSTVTLNGCDIEAYAGEETSEHHFVNGTVDIVCPEGKKVEIHVYSSHTSHTSGTAACTVTVGSQTKLLGNTAQNITGSPDHVKVVTEISNLAISADGILCSGAKTATYTGTTTVKAYKDVGTDAGPPVVYTEGSQIGLTVSK